jgi:hypothetical protein
MCVLNQKEEEEEEEEELGCCCVGRVCQPYKWSAPRHHTIRQGIATVQENVLQADWWMLERVVISMNRFAQYLPDMNLAFNLNNESRIAVPYEEITRNQERGRGSGTPNGAENWSNNRSDRRLPISEQDFPETVFHDMSFRNTFAAYGSVGCPPSSVSSQ